MKTLHFTAKTLNLIFNVEFSTSFDCTNATDELKRAVDKAFRLNSYIKITPSRSKLYIATSKELSSSNVCDTVSDYIEHIELIKNFSNILSIGNEEIPEVSKPTAPVETVEMHSHEEIVQFIKTCYKYKPVDLKMPELKWRFLVRSALTGSNIMMTGHSGCGKTVAAYGAARMLAERMGYDFVVINLGSTQDPRSTIVGNTHYDKERGTFFAQSAFVKAISTPKTIILLDEASRAHPDAWNILMSVLDAKQRFLRIDEDPNTPVIEVAKNVCFIATANIGSQYTSTRVMDYAFTDRFVIIEMDPLDKDNEYSLLTSRYPKVDTDIINSIADLACITRSEVSSGNGQLDTIINTRKTSDWVSLINDGFTFTEGAEVCVYPQYSDKDQRQYVKQLIQKYISNNTIEEEPQKKADLPF
jgi:hypothetical protein